MPELPEVETVRRTLKNFVLHKTIDSIEVRYTRIIDGDVEAFVSTLIHQSICDIDRYGKYLIFILDHDAFISHLRMEGKYNIKQKDEPYDKHDHIIFHMTDGTDLRYNDTRKFGRMQLVDKEHYREYPPLNRLGQEPMDASFDYIYPRIHQSETSCHRISGRFFLILLHPNSTYLIPPFLAVWAIVCASSCNRDFLYRSLAL